MLSPIVVVLESIAFLYFSEATNVRTPVLIAMIKKRITATMTVDFFCKFIPSFTL